MKSILSIIFLSFSIIIFAQFEGEIIYKTEIKNNYLDSLINEKSSEELKKINPNYYDTLTIFIKDSNFSIWRNNQSNEKNILIEKENKEYTITDKAFYNKKKEKQLTSIDLLNPRYNKDNFNGYQSFNITVSQIDFQDKKCEKHVLKDAKISEVFIICNDSLKTNILRNYLVSPYTGQNLNSEFYAPFRNKIIYYYELNYRKTKFISTLIKLFNKKLDDDIFVTSEQLKIK